MKNIFKKSFLLFASCLLAVSAVAANAVALNPGTYSLASAQATSGSKKFNTYQNIYYGRNGGGLGANNGVEVKSGGMFAFKIAAASTIKFKVRNSKTKSITDTWSVKSISDADLEGIIAQCASGGNASTYYTNNNSELSSITITQTGVATAYTNETSVLQPGCYGFYLSSHSADGDYVEEIVIASSGPSSDATLKSIKYDGTSVPGFSPSQLEYSVELPATATTPPTVTAEANDAKATVSVTPATSLPGYALIDVTAEDGTTQLQYKVLFEKASAAPKVLTATWDNIRGTATIDQVAKTITGQVTNGSSLNLAPTFTGNNFNNGAWTPTGAQNFANGPINYTFTSSVDASTTTYSVTITEAPPMSSDATLKSLKYNNTSVPNFSPTTLTYNIELPSGTSTIPTVTAEANDSKATATVTPPSGIPGVAKVKVVAEDGTELTYTINFTVAVPGSDLTLHVPGKYEEKEIAGGYNAELSVFDGHEYEVYYINRDGDSKLSLATSNGDKAGSITNSTGENSAKAKDGWLTLSATGSGSDTNGAAKDEFGTSIRKINMQAGSEILLHIQGYDLFSFYGKDNSNSTTKCFEVYINGVKQNTTPDNTYSIRRFPLTTGENLIRVTALSTSSSSFVALSLRVAQEPRCTWLKGNDSTQVVWATTAPKPIYYFTKYNNIPGAETKLEWTGTAADGITLATAGQGEIGDTLMISGVANAEPGIYNYKVVSYYNGTKTTEVPGKFEVINYIKELTDTIVDAYVGEEMDELRFRLYTINPSGYAITWRGSDYPEGHTSDLQNNVVIIHGIMTKAGTFPYTIAVNDGNAITGKINVLTFDPGNDPVLYLYKNNGAYDKDGIYAYLKSTAGGSRNLVPRKAKTDGLRAAEQYSKYKWIYISEDVDADNAEVLAIANGGVNLPVLNMKSFSYSPGRLDWGEPNNGSLSENGQSITVVRPDHPIFQALNQKKGDKIKILSEIDFKGLMPADVDYEGSLCLATALTRDMEDYNGDGEEQTFLHEIPAALRNGNKYICMPIALQSSTKLTNDGKNFVKQVITYLLNTQATVSVPELKITSMKISGVEGVIDEANSTISFEFNKKQYPSLDITAITPVVTVANPTYTHVTPGTDEVIDFSASTFAPVVFTVTDYINRRAYDVKVRLFEPQGIEEIYSVGDWVNVYDIYGRKIATTNENIYNMALPTGVYIIVLENGDTFRILK